MTMETISEVMMKRALILARKGLGKTSPNPAVGCVIVRKGTIVGEGWHKKAGTPHAEVHALREAGTKAAGADVYVTLEPCAHFGRTPPCAQALIKAGVKNVYVGMIDPNPLVSGRGVRMLQEAGIDVKTGILEKHCRQLNEVFIKHIATGKPFVTFKCAMTLDGRIATSSGDSKWITNEKSRYYVHKLRSMVDVIMVGVGTIIADDPQLTCRVAGGRNPVRVVVDSNLRIPIDSQVLCSQSSVKTIVATLMNDSAKGSMLRRAGAELLLCKARDGRVDLRDLFERLGQRGFQSVLLEGGGEIAGSALHDGLIDKFLLFYAPKLVGGAGTGPFAGSGVERMADAFRLENMNFRRFDNDILVEGYPEVTCLPV